MMSLSQQLDFFCRELPRDRSIDELEELEGRYKETIRDIAKLGDTALACELARAQQEIGFLLKYKSYGIKASTPLGLSLFFLEPHQGFSFQRHREVKTETFYFLDTPHRSFAYLCESHEWESEYDEKTFSEWLGGAQAPSFERYCYMPRPGDVMRVERPGVVHTAIGCVLEEYANVSTDSVERLHDQNRGKPIPKKFNREYFGEKMKHLTYPEATQLVTREGNGFHVQSLHWREREGLKILTLNDTDSYRAEQFIIAGGLPWRLKTDDEFISFFVTEGDVECTLADRSLLLKKHDTFLSVPRCSWTIRPTSGPARISLLAIKEHKAFL